MGVFNFKSKLNKHLYYVGINVDAWYDSNKHQLPGDLDGTQRLQLLTEYIDKTLLDKANDKTNIWKNYTNKSMIKHPEDCLIENEKWKQVKDKCNCKWGTIDQFDKSNKCECFKAQITFVGKVIALISSIVGTIIGIIGIIKYFLN